MRCGEKELSRGQTEPPERGVRLVDQPLVGNDPLSVEASEPVRYGLRARAILILERPGKRRKPRQVSAQDSVDSTIPGMRGQ